MQPVARPIAARLQADGSLSANFPYSALRIAVRGLPPGYYLREAKLDGADALTSFARVARSAAGDRLAGMVTDRDIAIRAVAIGKGPETTVGEVMSSEVLYCHEDEEIAHVSRNMGEKQVRRLPVVDVEKRLVGILSLADVASLAEDTAGEALQGVTQPGGLHSQSIQGRA
jgi:CBS domain-containing protein